MKVLIYFEGQETISRSGIGRAMAHQLKALSLAGVETCISPKEGGFDIAHINTYWGKSHLLLHKMKKENIPVIVHGHSTYEDFQNSFRCWKLIYPFYRYAIRSMYEKADYVISPTTYAASLIRKHDWNKHVCAISNGISLEEYAPDQTKIDAFREEFHLKNDEKYVIGVGFPFVRKGILDFIEVGRAMPELSFYWFGSLQKILTEQKVLSAMKKAPKNVHFPGYVKGDLIKGAYQGALATLFPTYEETEGIVALEALASHSPLIVRPIGVFEGWLEKGKNCYMGNSVSEFVSILKELEQKGPSSDILEEGWRVAEERSLFRVGEKLKLVYESLLKEKH